MHRQVAKDLIIDSAAGWEYKTVAYRNKATMGYGLSLIHICYRAYVKDENIVEDNVWMLRIPSKFLKDLC